MTALGYNVPLHRTLAFGLAAFIAALAGDPVRLVERADRPGDRGPPATIDLLVIAVIGGLARARAWLGAFAFIVTESRDVSVPSRLGGSFNTDHRPHLPRQSSSSRRTG